VLYIIVVCGAVLYDVVRGAVVQCYIIVVRGAVVQCYIIVVCGAVLYDVCVCSVIYYRGVWCSAI
jgi:hypothetical protein